MSGVVDLSGIRSPADAATKAVPVIVDGTVTLDLVLDYIKSNWREMAGQGRPLLVVLGAEDAPQVISQRYRDWAMMRELHRSIPHPETGEQESPERWHEYFRARLLGNRKDGVSTGKLGFVHYAQYMDEVEGICVSELLFTFKGRAAPAEANANEPAPVAR